MYGKLRFLRRLPLTDMDINDNSKKIFERIVRVNSVINGCYAGEPPYSFAVKHSADDMKQTRQSAYLMMVCAVPMMLRGIIRSSFHMRMAGIVLAIIAIVTGIISLIAASNMEKKSVAVVEGDYITIKGRPYHHSEISELKKGSLNCLLIMSEGKKIASVGKSWDGCLELVQWAQYRGIAINDDSSVNVEELQKKQGTLVAVVVLGCLVVVTLLIILPKLL